LNLCAKGIDSIHEGLFKKVVVSRKEIETDSFDLVSVFEKLIKAIRMLLLLLVSSKIGLWMGATPERLLKAENKSFLLWQ
jgi:isochorismate synthase